MNRAVAVLICTAAALLAGCGATEFYGGARFPKGAKGCYAKCQELNMEMGAYVLIGEYSTACVCEMKRRDSTVGSRAASVGAAVAGVMEQTRERAAQQAAAQGAAANQLLAPPGIAPAR